MFKTVNLKKMIEKLALLLLVLWIFVRPIEKYYENVYHSLRINFTILALFFLFVLLGILLLKIVKNKRINLNKENIFALFLILLVVSIQLVSLPILLNYMNMITVLKYFSMTFIGYLSFYFMGRNLVYISQKRKILYFSWILSTLVYFNAFLISDNFFIYLDGAQIYLMLADAYAILSIFVMVLVEKKYIKYVTFIITSFILFTLVSRTSFFLFIFVSIIYFSFLNWKLSLVLFSLLFMGIITNFDYIVNDLGKKNRMIRLFTTGEDSSLNHRYEIKLDNRKHITIERIALGEYMSDVIDFGHSGHYIHSYESFLYSFGILPFVWLYGILGFIFFKLVANIKLFLQDSILQLIGILGLFLTIEIMFSRAYVTPYIWIIIGALPVLIQKVKLLKKRSS